MSDAVNSATANYDVIVIGGGPAGLSAATELKRLGVPRVAVFEREPIAGGIPRHCGHPPFGMREFTRILTGPQYAKRMVKVALDAGVELLTSTSVVEAKPGGRLIITSNNGLEEKTARRIVIATGVRETPRAARLISGTRPLGVINTGALQSMIYLKNQKPFERPVIVGTELVSFSAIQTCRHAKIRPVAMIEQSDRVTARWPTAEFARLVGIPVHLKTRLLEIKGGERTSAVVIEDHNGVKRTIDCDGVILTGQFTPEASLARSGHLTVDPASGGPVVDQFGRCSDPAYFATGNLLRPVETAGWSWNEGRKIGRWIADDLAGKLSRQGPELQIVTSDNIIRFAVPQRIQLPYGIAGMQDLQLRFSKSAKGTLVALSDEKVIYKKRMSVHPERRFLIPLHKIVGNRESGHIELRFDEMVK
ncbi:pyridine nucleotide-disulfide oxidoreductase [Alphaproteobacteria bacterium 46_93_T64]|nr:pyridine nucleotide-disulfide oxidoreductase [Alphaproteobacteria bacterium 46_93_T64]